MQKKITQIFTGPNVFRPRSPARRDIGSKIHFGICYGTHICHKYSALHCFFVVLHCRINQHFFLFGPHPKPGQSGQKCGRLICAMKQVVKSCNLLFVSFIPSCLSGFFEIWELSRLSTLIKSSIPHHGVDCTQQSPSHGNISLGITSFFDQSLPNSLLPGIRSAKRNTSFTDCPSEGSRAGFSNLSGLSSAGRLFVVRSKSCPEFKCIGVGESVKWTDLSCDNTRPDFINAGDAFKYGCLGREFLTSIGKDDFPSQTFPLSFDKRDDIGKVCKSISLGFFKQVSMSQL